MYLPSPLFILFLYLNVCTARHLVAVEEACSTKINISGNGKVSENPKKQPSESNGATKTEDINDVHNNTGDMERDNLKALESTEKRGISGHVPIKSVVSVSWSVPPRKQGKNQNPGFYSDYSRPRTRPPSHN